MPLLFLTTPFDLVYTRLTTAVATARAVILSNFNHERWVICVRIARYNRLIYEETFKWAHLRMSAGKRLIDNAVVRAK